MASSNKFRDYLVARLPEEYPISTIPLSLSMERNHCNELIFQQSVFLDDAQRCLETKPARAYIAALKHQCLVAELKLDTVRFIELAEKQFFSQVQNKCDEIFRCAADRLNDDVKSYCRRLLKLQRYEPMLTETISIANEALSYGIRSFEPPMSAPDKPADPQSGALAFGAAIVSGVAVFIFDYWVLNSVHPIPPLIAAFVGLVISIVPLWPMVRREKAAIARFGNEMARFAEFERLRDAFDSQVAMFESQLGLDRKQLAADLSNCAKQLTQLISQRRILEDKLIGQF